MIDELSVAAWLRQAADYCLTTRKIMITRECLLDLANRLDPDGPPDAARHATQHPTGMEAIGEANAYRVLYSWQPTSGVDDYSWRLCYKRGYRPARYPLPTIFLGAGIPMR